MRKLTVSKLKKKLDLIFSRYIRQRDQNKCFTCGKFAAQAGHYVSRSHNQLRFDERNVNAQCVSCNIFLHGNMDEYALKLQKKYGKNILKELAAEKRKIKQFTIKELQGMIDKYSELLDNSETQRQYY